MVAEALFSSKNDSWTTPKDLFDKLNFLYQFTLDAASSDDNCLCEKHYTLENDGLEQSWEGERVFCNPPYSKIKDWARKFAEEGTKGNCLIVALVPARTDTRWWHEHAKTADLIHYIKGRLKFGNSPNSAPFPSALLFWFGLNKIT